MSEVLLPLAINYFSARIESLRNKQVGKLSVIEALKEGLSPESNNKHRLFLDTFHRAVQHSEELPDYTRSLEQIMKFLSKNGLLDTLIEHSFTGSSTIENSLEFVANQVEQEAHKINYVFPEQLGGSALGFVNLLLKLIRIFLETLEKDKLIFNEINSIKLHFSKPRYPVNAIEISPELSTNSFMKFKFDRRFVSEQIHEKLYDEIERFLTQLPSEDNSKLPNILITSIYGAGGLGKSRFAFELCLKRRNLGWHSGFVMTGENIHPLSCRWDTSCLLVFDYASLRSKEIEKFIRSCFTLHEQKLLKHPVRILLLERECNHQNGWYYLLTQNEYIAPFLYREKGEHLPEKMKFNYFELPKLTYSKLEALSIEYLLKHKINKDDARAMAKRALEHAKNIEKAQPRPLLALIIVEIIRTNGHVDYSNLESLLESFYLREENMVLQMAGSSHETANRFWAFMAVVTIVGGLNVTRLREVYKKGKHIDWFTKNASSNVLNIAREYFHISDSSFLPPLEPDLLGEYLIIRFWRSWYRNEDIVFDWETELRTQLSLAFSLSSKTKESLIRLCTDFPHDNPFLDNALYLDIFDCWSKEKNSELKLYNDFLLQFCHLNVVSSHEGESSLGNAVFNSLCNRMWQDKDVVFTAELISQTCIRYFYGENQPNITASLIPQLIRIASYREFPIESYPFIHKTLVCLIEMAEVDAELTIPLLSSCCETILSLSQFKPFRDHVKSLKIQDFPRLTGESHKEYLVERVDDFLYIDNIIDKSLVFNVQWSLVKKIVEFSPNSISQLSYYLDSLITKLGQHKKVSIPSGFLYILTKRLLNEKIPPLSFVVYFLKLFSKFGGILNFLLLDSSNDIGVNKKALDIACRCLRICSEQKEYTYVAQLSCEIIDILCNLTETEKERDLFLFNRTQDLIVEASYSNSINLISNLRKQRAKLITKNSDPNDSEFTEILEKDCRFIDAIYALD